MTTHRSTATVKRARRSFWILVAVGVLASGSLSSAVLAGPSPATGLRVAASGLVLIASVLLAARVYSAIDRAVGIARSKATSDHRKEGSR